jgi:dTDP-4-amino-4,6-dideoxygalactose transaminase
MGADYAIPFADLAHQRDPLADEIAAAIGRVVAASDYILGAELEAFEREFAGYCGVEHAVGVGSGTAALALGIEALAIGPGDEVIVPAHTYVSSALAVLHAGAEPVFCEVSEPTGLIDPAAAATAVGERTAAVMPVHLYGQACDMTAIGELAASHGLAVIEDAAQAHGASWDRQRVGSFGALAAFSFYPTKNLGAFGDGGMICTDDGAVAAAARRLRNLGQPRKGTHTSAGYNERLDTLQAAILRVKLPLLEGWNEARRELAARYREALGERVACLPVRDRAIDVYHLFPVRVAERDAAAADLAEAGIETGLHYPAPVHLLPPFRRDGIGRSRLARAEAWAREELSLPIYPGLGAGGVQRVSARLLASLGDRAGFR